jgi:hypothetical protein
MIQLPRPTGIESFFWWLEIALLIRVIEMYFNGPHVPSGEVLPLGNFQVCSLSYAHAIVLHKAMTIPFCSAVIKCFYVSTTGTDHSYCRLSSVALWPSSVPAPPSPSPPSPPSPP